MPVCIPSGLFLLAVVVFFLCRSLTSCGRCAGLALGRGVFLRLAIGVFVKGEDVFVGHTVVKVDDGVGVDGDAHVTCLEVEMGTCAASGVASERDGVAGLDYLVGLHEKAAEVAVDGLHAVGVTHHYVVTVTSALIFCEAYFAREGGSYSVAYLELQVHAVVVAAETCAIAVIGCLVAGTGVQYSDTSMSL